MGSIASKSGSFAHRFKGLFASPRRPAKPTGGLEEVDSQRRLADHLPEQVPREPTPCQVPPPELADNRPLPLALCSPEATLTLTAPLPATLPRTGIPPEP